MIVWWFSVGLFEGLSRARARLRLPFISIFFYSYFDDEVDNVLRIVLSHFIYLLSLLLCQAILTHGKKEEKARMT